MSDLLLGKQASYESKYNPNLLFPIARHKNRDLLPAEIKFEGTDIWNCYEVSWLSPKGKPEVRIITFYVPADTPNIVESKSLKLYLNSFNNEKYSSESEVQALIKQDLEKIVGGKIDIIMRELSYFADHNISSPKGLCIDDIEVECDNEQLSNELLKISAAEQAEENLYSNLFKSNCLVTGQPDWATLMISYKGPKISHASLLKYIVSYRNHNEFHEHCVERIYADLLTKCHCRELTVYARFTRRGGVDINPFRSSEPVDLQAILNNKLARQ